MFRNSGASLVAGLVVLCVCIIGGVSLIPRGTRSQMAMVFRPQVAVAQDSEPTPQNEITYQTSEPIATLPATDTPEPTPVPTLTSTPTAIPTDGPAVGELGSSIDRYLNNLVKAKLFHGAVLIARGNHVLLSKGYGPADIDHGIANSANTRFRIASVTKQFTAMAVMQLVAAGKLSVDDPLCKFIEQCPERWAPITVRHLLTHTHGLPNYTDFPSYEQIQMNPISVNQMLDRLRLQWPVWRPGAEYHYGNTGYFLLGVIIEKLSGQSYGAYLHDHIFAPLGMDNSGVTYAPAPGANWATPYQSFSGLAPPLDTSTLFAAGSVYSTVEDMYRWDQALYGETLLPATLRDQMFTPFLGKYGYGWKIIQDHDHLRYSHPGEMDGARTVILRYPNDRVTVIVLANMHDADADGIAAYIGRLVLDS